MKDLRKNPWRIPLHTQILLSAVLGAFAGLILPSSAVKLKFMGDAFLKLLQMIILPLVFTSVASGVMGAGSRGIGRMALKTFLYYVFSSLAAIVTGQVLVSIIRPGSGTSLHVQGPFQLDEKSLGVADTVLNMIPANPVKAFAEGKMIQIIVLALFAGVFILRMRNEKYRNTLSHIIHGTFELLMDLTEFIVKLAPIGIFFLIAYTVSQTGASAFRALIWYALTVAGGLAIHAFITLPLCQFMLGRRNPLTILQKMAPALLTAFSTSSSSATLPVTLERAKHSAGFPERVSGFVLPLGATINMDGTALYECVAAVFIAQVYGVTLTFSQQLTIAFTALLASIGAAGVPMAGLVMLTVVLKSVGLPLEGVGIILAVDRVLDMMRTTVNVWSDITAVVVVSKWEEPPQEGNEA